VWLAPHSTFTAPLSFAIHFQCRRYHTSVVQLTIPFSKFENDPQVTAGKWWSQALNSYLQLRAGEVNKGRKGSLAWRTWSTIEKNIQRCENLTFIES
jgi:hypothetical protein